MSKAVVSSKNADNSVSRIALIIQSASESKMTEDEAKQIMSLLDAGEDPNTHDDQGLTPLDLLIEKYGQFDMIRTGRAPEIMKQLIAHGACLMAGGTIDRLFNVQHASWCAGGLRYQVEAPEENHYNQEGQSILHVFAQRSPFILWVNFGSLDLEENQPYREEKIAWARSIDQDGNSLFHALWSENGGMVKENRIYKQMKQDGATPADIKNQGIHRKNAVMATLQLTNILKDRIGLDFNQTNHEGVSVFDVCRQQLDLCSAMSINGALELQAHLKAEVQFRELNKSTPGVLSGGRGLRL